MPLPSFDGSFEEPHRKQQLVDAVFDQVSSRYDLGNELLSFGMHRVWRQRLIDYARVQPHHRVLDIACGTGDVTFLVAPLVREVVGSDNNASMLELARRKQPGDITNARFVEADAAALPFEDATFDRVLISFAARGLPPLDAVARECFRVLKPRGELWNLDFARPSRRPLDLAYRATLYGLGAIVGTLLHGDPRTYTYIPVSMAHYRGQYGLDATFRAAGFAPTEVIEPPLALIAYNRGVKPAA